MVKKKKKPTVKQFAFTPLSDWSIPITSAARDNTGADIDPKTTFGDPRKLPTFTPDPLFDTPDPLFELHERITRGRKKKRVA